MNTFPAEIQVVNSILEGIKDAHKNVVWLNSVPEYLMNKKVAL